MQTEAFESSVSFRLVRAFVTGFALAAVCVYPNVGEAVSTGDGGDSEVRAVDARALLEDLERVEKTARSWGEFARSGGASTPAEVVADVGSDPSAERLFRWVREHVEFEPYRGAVRGPRTVLAARAANAVDQSRLLATLCDHAGISYRYVLGDLREIHAAQLMERYAGRAARATGGSGEAQALLSRTPAYTGSEFLEPIASHLWLEVKGDDGTYLAADPAVGSTFGQTKGRAERRTDHLPPEYRPRLEVVLEATLKGGHQKSLLAIEAGLDRIAFEPVHLTFDSASVRRTVVPRIRLVGRSETGERFVPEKLERLVLKYDARYGSRERHYERELFVDRDGDREFRHHGVSATALVVPGWASRSRAARTASEQVKARTEGVRRRLERAAERGVELGSNAVEPLLSAAGTFGALAHTLQADAFTARIGQAMGVRPVRLEPRFLHAVATVDGDGIAMEVESRGGRIAAIPTRGVSEHAATAFRTLRGYGLDELGAKLEGRLTGRSIPSTRDVLAAARARNVPVTTLHEGNLESIGALHLPAAAERDLRRSVEEAGRIVLTPKRPVEVDARRRFAWWSIEPNGGAVRGRDAPTRVGFFDPLTPESGRGGASVGRALRRGAKRVSAALASPTAYRDIACRGLRQARSVSRALCATRQPRSLPTVSSCGSGQSESSGSSGGIGVVGLEVGSCRPLAESARCGASAAQTLLTGQIRVRARVADSSASVAPGRTVPVAASPLRCGPK